ncbi:MAG: hypothetical protein LBH93_07620 [Chitinispirillales bacterium]|jgi:hypothetical protein|nr:hypothetical protein [Chitinispirillales bacterium]
MNINGIGGAAGSWAQFVKLTQAARERNTALAADNKPAIQAPQKQPLTQQLTPTQMPQINAAISIKHGANVYSSIQSGQSIRAATPSQSRPGGIFDAYA